MLNETFYIDGVDARDFGIYLQKPIEFSEAIPVVERQSVPGRNGDLIFETGSYENRTATAHCFCLQRDVEKALGAAGQFLMSKHGYRRLETSDDPDHFWLARVENSPQIAHRMKLLAPFTITFDCKPQRFLKNGDMPVTMDFGENEFVTIRLYNQFFTRTEPLIHIVFRGEENNNADLYFQGPVVQGTKPGVAVLTQQHVFLRGINGSDLYFDCETGDAYNQNGNQNNKVTVHDGEVPFISPLTDTAIQCWNAGESLCERIEITPRWWEL